MPIQAAFHDNIRATVSVATGPIMNPEIQSRSNETKHLTPASLPQLDVPRTRRHLGFRNHALGHPQI